MPFWLISHTPGMFTPSDKAALASAITHLYTHGPDGTTTIGLPAFYVNVQFFSLPSDSLYIGGKQVPNACTLSITHLARQISADEAWKTHFLQKIDALLTPWMKERGWRWEYFIVEGRIDMWRIDGAQPPAAGSELENLWKKEGKVVKESE